MLGLVLAIQALTVAVSGPATSLEYLPIRVAEAEGYFVREGLTVTLRTTRAETGAAEALAQGQADLVATTLDALLRFGTRTMAKAPRLVFGLTAAPPVAVLVSPPHATDVRSLDDLPGLRIGFATPGAPEHAWFGWLLARAGLSVAQMGIMSLGPRGLATAIDAGDVHVGVVHEPLASRMLREGRATLLADFRTPAAVVQALSRPTVNAAIFARGDRVLNDATLTAFARALLAAERRIRTAKPGAIAARLSTRMAGGAAAFDGRLQAAQGLYLADGLVSVEQLHHTVAIIRSHLPLNGTLKLPRPEDMLYTGPLRQALRARPPA